MTDEAAFAVLLVSWSWADVEARKVAERRGRRVESGVFLDRV